MTHAMITPPSGITLHYQGPSIPEGKLPALFYFTSSAEDSLSLDPLNLPAAFLASRPIRVYTSTLPLHDSPSAVKDGMKLWAEAQNPRLIADFIDSCCQNLDFLMEKNAVDPEKIAVAGLSRGSLIALLFAAQDPRIKAVLGYAPLIELGRLEEFEQDHPMLAPCNLYSRAEELIHKKLRFYIGNRDQRVGTETCFHFVQHVAEVAFQHGNRSPDVELIVSPSIGRFGHGTPPHIFLQGVDWLKRVLEL